MLVVILMASVPTIPECELALLRLVLHFLTTTKTTKRRVFDATSILLCESYQTRTMQQQITLQRLFFLNDVAVSFLLNGNYEQSLASFRCAAQALNGGIETDEEDADIAAEWGFRLRIVANPLNSYGQLLTHQGDAVALQAYTFEMPRDLHQAGLSRLSAVEMSLMGTVLVFNVGLCYHLQSILGYFPSVNLSIAQRLYSSATRAASPVVRARTGPLSPDLFGFLVSLGNNLGCIGAEQHDALVLDASLSWYRDVVGGDVGNMVNAPVQLNYFRWQDYRANPSPAA